MGNFLLFLLLASLLVEPGQAEVRNVWQLGKFDQSPVEFSRNAADTAAFRIGSSDPGKNWPGRQQTGHTYKILFSLNSITGVYSLKIGTLIEQPRVPMLQININGHAGWFYLHPKLSYSRGDFSYAFDPHESQSSVLIDIPPAFLKLGENAIAITCLDDPPTPPGEKEIGGITYDALSLEQDTSRKYVPKAVTADPVPTILYRQTPAGLAEVVDVFLGFNGHLQRGDAELSIGSNRYTAVIAGGREWGQ
jgi:hypothetical protein